MAGVTDQPFRLLARRMGAALTVSEMVSSDPRLRHSRKSRLRLDHTGEPGPISVQIVGTDPRTMAAAASLNVAQGAQIIDINMGCPAKKVCKTLAGSALLRNEPLVARILSAVVAAVDAPVTLKIRTGWDREHNNAVRIARLAEDCGIQAVTVHGRTRADGYRGAAEYDTIAAVARAVTIPVIANGDIDSPVKAGQVLDYTRAQGVMIGRAAQGKPWIFREICHFLATAELLPEPGIEEVKQVILEHLDGLYQFYGKDTGVRVARKHIRWFCSGRPGEDLFWRSINKTVDCDEQLRLVSDYFVIGQHHPGAPLAA
jgi:tRNA-dihydrouridine synthase B